MKKQLLIYWPLLINSLVVAQPNIQWQRTFGGSLYDEAQSVSLTLDGGYFLTGQTVSDDIDVIGNHGLHDFWAIKLDSAGSIEWKKAYGGSGEEVAHNGIQTLDGGYALIGYTESNDYQVSGNHGDKDVWVLKLDSQGEVEWQKCFGGTNWDEGWEIKQTKDGGYVLAGRTNSNDGDVSGNHASMDYWIIKLSLLGEIEWQKSLGGTNFDFGYTIIPTPDGGYLVGGESQSTDGQVTNNPGGLSAWIIKLNFEGKILWQKTLGGLGIDRINEIISTRTGGFVLLGQTSSNDGDVNGNHGGLDLWVINLTDSGEIVWQKALGGSDDDAGFGIIQAIDGSYVAVGISRSNNGNVSGNHGSTDLWLVKLSETGDLLWQRAFGGTLQERGFSVKQTPDGGYAVFGDAWSSNGDVIGGGLGKTDYWFLKLGPESSATSTPSSYTLNIFPNPAQQSISLQISETTSALNVCISDVLGQLMSRRNGMRVENGKIDLEVSDLPAGVYLVSAMNADGQVFSGRFIKE